MRTLVLTLSLSAAFILFSGCEQTSSANNAAIITAKQTPIATVTPEFGTFSSQVTATASIEPSPDGIVSISSPVMGTIDSVRVGIGDKVAPSSPLIVIRSADVSDTQNDRLAAKAAYQQAKRTYEMNKELLALGAITANDFALSESSLKQSEAMLKSFDQKLNYYGASSSQMLTLRSPISGVVYEISTHLGEKVDDSSGTVLAKIANPHKKMVVATVYEKDLSAFEKGKKVSITIQNHEDANLTGTVDYVSDVLDAENRTTKVYIKPDTDSSLLRLNMFATIYIDAQNTNVLRIPKKSLLFREGKFVVYVNEQGTFRPHTVTLVTDDPSDDYSLIRGIDPKSLIALEAIALEKQ